MALLVEQIFTHLYTEKFLDIRYVFREAVNFMNLGEKINNIMEILRQEGQVSAVDLIVTLPTNPLHF